MSGPGLVTVVVLLVVAYVFLVIGKWKSEEIDDLDDFLFYGRTLEDKGYTRTFVATGISLATVLAFFLDFGGQFGFAILLSPLMYLVGVWVFLRLLPVLDRTEYIQRGTTLHAFLGRIYKDNRIRYLTGAVSILGYIGILIIELHVGVQIFRYFGEGTAFLAGIVTLLAIAIFVYSWLGGFKAVVDTDRIQLWLIGGATVCALVVLLLLCGRRGEWPSVGAFVPDFRRLPLSLVVVLVVGNIPLQMLRMSNWQRVAAVGDLKEVQVGLRKAIVFTFIFWALFNVLGVLQAAISIPVDVEFGNLELLKLMSESGGIIPFVALPLVFAGMVAALVSTADSILVPIITSWIYDFRHYDQLHEKGFASRVSQTPALLEELLNSARRSIKWFVLLTVGLYWVLIYFGKFDFVSLLFVFFNQQLVLFPAVAIALGSKGPLPNRVKITTMVAVVVGWLGVWLSTTLGTLTEQRDLVYYASVIGFGIAAAIPFVLRDTRRAYRVFAMRIVKGQ